MGLWNVTYYDKKILEYCRNQSTLNGAIKKSIKHFNIKINSLTLTGEKDVKYDTTAI